MSHIPYLTKEGDKSWPHGCGAPRGGLLHVISRELSEATGVRVRVWLIKVVTGELLSAELDHSSQVVSKILCYCTVRLMSDKKALTRRLRSNIRPYNSVIAMPIAAFRTSIDCKR